MPELPEVETVRRGVERYAVGRTVAEMSVLHPRAVRRHVPGALDLAGRLCGRTLLAARRRGKFLWLPLSPAADGSDEALMVHLGMSGQLLVQPAAADDGPHLRVRLRFTDGDPELRFVDQRTFGGLVLDRLIAADDGHAAPSLVQHVARDPLDAAFDDEAFVTALRGRRSGVKRALLDQTLVSGIGNIYADESLWRARLHYAREARSLSRGEAQRLLQFVREILLEALDSGGTSFDALYVDVNGRSGYFDRSLQAYGQQDRPCGRCGTPIRRDAFMNRSSFFCPRCQRAPRPR